MLDESSLYFLEQYGIPREVLEAIVFEHGGDSTLLEIQAEGIRIGLCDPKKLLEFQRDNFRPYRLG